MHICPHTIRVIEDWAGKKVSPKNSTFLEDSKSRRNQSHMQQDSKDLNNEDGTGEESSPKKNSRKKNATCLTPDLDKN